MKYQPCTGTQLCRSVESYKTFVPNYNAGKTPTCSSSPMLLLLLDYLPRHYSRLLPCHKTNMSHSIGKRRLERRLDIPCWQNILMLASRSNTTLNAAADEPGDSFPITEYVIHSIVVGMEKFTATSTTTTCSSHISHTFLSHLDDSLFTRFFLLLAH